MTPAVPDPTVEALSEAERAQLEANFGEHQRLNSQGVCATCHGMGAVLAILAEHTERAVREAEASARTAWDVHAEHVETMNRLHLHDRAVAEEKQAEAVREALEAAAVRVGDLVVPDDLDTGMSPRQAWCLGALAAKHATTRGRP